MFLCNIVGMFRALADQRGFGESFENIGSFINQQTTRYTQQLQNPYLTVLPVGQDLQASQLFANAAKGLQTVDPNTRRANLRDMDLQSRARSIDNISGFENYSPLSTVDQIQNFAQTIDTTQEILRKQQVCKTTDIDTLLGSQNTNDVLRCGWIYQKGTPGDQPKISTGYLGTRNGPAQINEAVPSGRWFWNLDDAKKEILRDRCNALTSCANVGAENYRGCAFSTERGIGVPVDRNNNLLYPDDAALRGGGLVTNSSTCPPPPPVGSPAYELARSRDVCVPLPDGRLSRDCVLQQVTAAGCKTDGQLYVSLINEAQPNNYAAGLEQKTAFVRYQRDAQNPLQSSAIRDGNITTNLALQNFRSLATEASNTKDTAVNYAARDLCLKRGIMDEYDFCSDLTNATPSPFSLDCLQKEFRKQGGQPAGSEYPRTANLAKWNSFQNWGAVKNAIQQLAQRVRATNSEIQRKALQEFMGITREMPPRDQIPSIAGMDVFWINSGTNTFLGRRTTVGNAKLPDFVSDGEVASTGLSEYVQYVVLTNLRPPQDLSIQLRTETDDGTVWVLNKDLNPPAYRNISVDTSDTFGRYWDQPPTTHTLSACWNLRRGGANYLLGTWQETGGRAHTKTLYSVCGKNNFTEIPSNWFTLTQEPDAPMLAWEGMLQTETDAVSFRETRLPSIFNMNYTGSYFIKKSSEFPNIPCILNLVNAGFATTTMSYSMQSWRTLTIALSIQMVTRVTRLFTFGNFFCDIIPNGSTCVVSFGWDSATLVTSSTGGLSIQGVPFNKPILLFANIRPDYEGTYPNRLTVAAATLEEWANGNVSISGNSQRTKSVTTSQNNPLYNKSDAAQIRFGHPEWNSGCSFNIGWLHVFDYELNATDVARDATNAWVRVPWAA